MKKYLTPAIGVAAFVIGGIVARQKAFEIIEVLENTFKDKDVPPTGPNTPEVHLTSTVPPTV